MYDHTGSAVAAISVSFLAARTNQEHYECILESVRRAAKNITERMGGSLPLTKK
jgi:DNA-binding IclR family transcriptional regulator